MVTTEMRDKAEVGIIFERINSTGTKLSTLDLMIAWTWDETFHLKEAIDEHVEDLNEKGFGDLPDKIILQCLSGIISKKTSTRAILKLPSASVKGSFKKLKESMRRAVDFLSTEFNMQSQDFLPHAQQIVPLTYFFSKATTPSQGQTRAIKQWFWKTSFSRRYSGQTDDKMDGDIQFMDEVVANKSKSADSYSYSVNDLELIDLKFSKSNPITRALLLLMAQKPPLNLTNGNKIDLGKALSNYNLKEYHHIFPRAFLKTRGLAAEKINSICNFCFLPADSNKKISKKEPADYIFKIVPSTSYQKILESNIMPLKKDIYKENDYDAFLKERAGLVLAFLDSLTV